MTSAKLLTATLQNSQKFFLQFGGQGSPYLKELVKLYAEPELKEFFETSFKTIAEIAARDGKSPLLNEGFDFKSWIENPDGAPSEDYLARAPISVPGIFMTQIANYVLVSKRGYPTVELIKATGAVSGHSQGVIASALVGLGKDGADFLKAYSDFLKFVFYLGFNGQKVYPNFVVSEEVVKENEANGDKNPAPMVAVIGYTKDELEERVKKTNDSLGLKGQDTVFISLYNTPDSMILSALPSSLLAFRKQWKAEMDEKKFKFVYLKTTAPFHCPFMETSLDKFNAEDASVVPFPYTGADLKVPVYSIYDGHNLQKDGNLRDILFKMVLIEPLYWDLAIAPIFNDSAINTIIDFGPSVVSQRLTGGHLKAKNIEKQSLCASNAKELKVILEA
ncbi:ACP S-malonyltransferase [Leptospira kanakyensis]|uniref:ACP S-malonyltransferase n=1 Tax=Leptospira kanakyensis TaxID=2484968 RepID=A0A6N4QEV3_9LEPT|nr:ACP S-malonyltransferase [Leptospira kanakyensis]TGK50575.1 ACP S-malonyltransferase [Leptospira kanakyensis]TGK63824.1 ACP S-malonyltransferase [Leptospira kanakyensis]TGK69713.1 ACP S-malonyltransferase [Leptospira kanakyensis]